jgi:hypothetical protein
LCASRMCAMAASGDGNVAPPKMLLTGTVAVAIRRCAAATRYVSAGRGSAPAAAAPPPHRLAAAA